MKFPSRLRWLWLTLVIVFFDRLTKGLVESRTVEGWRHEIVPNFLYLVHVRNPGIAFSMFADSQSPWVRSALIAGTLVVVAAIVWLLVGTNTGGASTTAGLALLLGGATGNLTDRILHGAVTDFFEVWLGSYHYPAFNVADSAITIGVIFVLLDVLRRPRKPRNAN